MIDIYNCEDSNDMYNPIKFKLLCKKSHGDPNDLHGRFYEEGKWYEAKLEFHSPSEDTKWQEFRACWVSHNEKFGGRFAVKGNIYFNAPNGYWPHFTLLFWCPVQMERDKKLNELI